MKIIRESEYNPVEDCYYRTVTYIVETLKEYRTVKTVLARNSFRFFRCLGDKGDKTSLNQMFYSCFNETNKQKKYFAKLYLIDCMED